jgi:hypothetical protein
MKKRHGVFFGFAVLLITAIFTFTGCDNNSGGDDVWLADLSNPFIGKWESDIPSANTHLIFDYKTNGTFDYEMVGVPADQGKGTGGYLVAGNVIVWYTASEGTAGYIFKVVDNDTIDATEIVEINENDGFKLGNTTSFTRVAGSPVNKENKPFVLDHPYLGKWRFDDDVVLPPDTSSVHYSVLSDMSADGILRFDYEMTGYPPDSKSTPYFIYDNKLVVYSEKDGIEISEFTPDNSEAPSTITFTEEYGVATFTRVSD